MSRRGRKVVGALVLAGVGFFVIVMALDGYRPDVPVPPGAKQSATDSEIYRMGAGYTYAELSAFYDQRMPIGKDWKGYAWCSTSGPASGGYWRTYAKGSESLVVVTNPPLNGTPAGIVIGFTEDDGDDC